ncbi:MAG: cyanophycin synthetase [Chloroflexota bacterium]
MTRSAAEIGSGLAPVRKARPIVPGERIHVVGIAGAGASAAALLARAAGAEVSGCDPGGPSPYSPAVESAGISTDWRHDAAHVTVGRPPSRLAVTKALTAVTPDHVELRAATSAGIPVESWQQVVADAAVGKRLVAVAGTHGKSTTSGWLVHTLAHAGMDPSAFVGALLPPSVTRAGAATARVGTGEVFVVEADEYAGNFDAFVPDVAVLTSVEWDHPDVFPDLAAVQAAFATWIRHMPGGATLVANVGDAGVEALLSSIAPTLSLRVIAYALTDVPPERGGYLRGIAAQYATAVGPAIGLLGRVTGVTPAGTTIEISGLDPLAGPVVVQLPTAGRHNVANALGVAGAAVTLGLEPASIVAGIETFTGIGRRLERKGEAAGVVVYDDYGHHPTAIRETIAAVRQREPGRRLWAVHEPLTFHRTAAMLSDLAAALAGADAIAIADIWAGRDPDTTLTNSEVLATAVRRLVPNATVGAPGSVETTAEWLSRMVRSGDVVLVMGGGHSYRIGELLLEHLEGRGG